MSNNLFNLTMEEKRIIENIASDFYKYGVTLNINEDGTCDIGFPNSSDVSDMFSTKLVDMFNSTVSNNGVDIIHMNTVREIMDERHWSWLDYISASSKDKVEAETKNINNEDLSLKFNNQKKEETPKKQTVKEPTREESLASKWARTIDEHECIDNASEVFKQYKQTIDKIKSIKGYHPMIDTMVHLYTLLGKTIIAYGVSIDKCVVENEKIVLRFSVPDKSELLICGKEAAGEHLATVIAEAFRNLFKDTPCSIGWKARSETWTVQISATMSSFANDLYSDLLSPADWYYFD